MTLYINIKVPSTVRGTSDAQYMSLSMGSNSVAKELKDLLSETNSESFGSNLRNAISDAKKAIAHMSKDEPSAYDVKSAYEKTEELIPTFNDHISKKSLNKVTMSGHCRQRTILLDEAEGLMNEYDNHCNKTILIVGGGISGLMTAWVLLDKGYRVLIVAKEWATLGKASEQGRITSQVAGALWEYPPGGCGLSEIEVPVLAYSKLDQYRIWALQSFLFYEALAKHSAEALAKKPDEPSAKKSDEPSAKKSDEDFGVTMKNLYQFFYHDLNEPCTGPNDRTAASIKEHKKKYDELLELYQNDKHLFRGKLQVKHTGSDEHAILGILEENSTCKGGKIDVNATALKWAYCHQAPVIDTDVAIEQLRAIVEGKGAILEIRTIEGDLHLHERELMDDFKADLIVNASGLGARELANNDQVFPVRGAVKRVSLDAENVNAVSPDSTVKVLDDSNLNTVKANAWLVPTQYHTDGSPGKKIFIVPRNDETLIVGSIIQRNNWDLASLAAESPEVKQMWQRAAKFLGCLANFTER
ncbi:hypothetical protein ASPCAL02663 [Aspergillus calidoustus]|uniref:FAD dependent oxidoreductase domain-containing protein n=1 Tax=Aspergillus calidoustus TaxID=454130 RepID=A0A0U5GMY7_ASPCI|nr:hypothetical protein ASPCAL02663 [Aspergillus calidoustus]